MKILLYIGLLILFVFSVLIALVGGYIGVVISGFWAAFFVYFGLIPLMSRLGLDGPYVSKIIVLFILMSGHVVFWYVVGNVFLPLSFVGELFSLNDLVGTYFLDITYEGYATYYFLVSGLLFFPMKTVKESDGEKHSSSIVLNRAIKKIFSFLLLVTMIMSTIFLYRSSRISGMIFETTIGFQKAVTLSKYFYDSIDTQKIQKIQDPTISEEQKKAYGTSLVCPLTTKEMESDDKTKLRCIFFEFLYKNGGTTEGPLTISLRYYKPYPHNTYGQAFYYVKDLNYVYVISDSTYNMVSGRSPRKRYTTYPFTTNEKTLSDLKDNFIIKKIGNIEDFAIISTLPKDVTSQNDTTTSGEPQSFFPLSRIGTTLYWLGSELAGANGSYGQDLINGVDMINGERAFMVSSQFPIFVSDNMIYYVSRHGTVRKQYQITNEENIKVLNTNGEFLFTDGENTYNDKEMLEGASANTQSLNLPILYKVDESPDQKNYEWFTVGQLLDDSDRIGNNWSTNIAVSNDSLYCDGELLIAGFVSEDLFIGVRDKFGTPNYAFLGVYGSDVLDFANCRVFEHETLSSTSQETIKRIYPFEDGFTIFEDNKNMTFYSCRNYDPCKNVGGFVDGLNISPESTASNEIMEARTLISNLRESD